MIQLLSTRQVHYSPPRIILRKFRAHSSRQLGDPVKSDLDMKQAKNIARIVLPLRNLAHNAVRTIDPEDELLILRVKTKKTEMFISYDERFTLISMQNVKPKPIWNCNKFCHASFWPTLIHSFAKKKEENIQGLEFFFISFAFHPFIASAVSNNPSVVASTHCAFHSYTRANHPKCTYESIRRKSSEKEWKLNLRFGCV